LTYLEDVDKGHHLVDEIFYFDNVVVGLEHSGSKPTVELGLNVIREVL